MNFNTFFLPSTNLHIEFNTYGFCSGRLFGCWFLGNILFVGWFCGCCGFLGSSSLSIASWTFGCWFGLKINLIRKTSQNCGNWMLKHTVQHNQWTEWNLRPLLLRLLLLQQLVSCRRLLVQLVWQRLVSFQPVSQLLLVSSRLVFWLGQPSWYPSSRMSLKQLELLFSRLWFDFMSK